MDNFEDIVRQITKFDFDQVQELFEHLGIPSHDWSSGKAKGEFEEIITKKIQTKPSHGKPHLTIVSGIPCSGKTTRSHKLSKVDKEAILIGFDDIMETLSFYKQLHSEKGNKVAFQKCELIAKIVGYRLLRTSLEKRFNIIFDHSSTPTEHLDLYTLAKSVYGYNVRMIHNSVTLKTALVRNKKGRKNDRYTSPDLIKERYIAMQSLINEYTNRFPVEILPGE